jgi:hypothetical protein
MDTAWLVSLLGILILWLAVVEYIEYRKIRFKRKVIKRIEHEIEMQRQALGSALVDWVDIQSDIEKEL